MTISAFGWLDSANIYPSISHQFFIKRSLDDNKNVYEVRWFWPFYRQLSELDRWNRLSKFLEWNVVARERKREEKERKKHIQELIVLSMTWSSGTCFRCLNHRAPKSKNWTVRHSIRFSKIKSNLKIFNVSIHLKHCCTLFERRTRWEERKTARWNRRMLSFLIFLTENRWESRKIYFEKWAYTTKNGKNHQIPIFSAKFFVSSCLYRKLQSRKFAIPFLIRKIAGDLELNAKK